mgnify:CR=1 FL=1
MFMLRLITAGFNPFESDTPGTGALTALASAVSGSAAATAGSYLPLSTSDNNNNNNNNNNNSDDDDDDGGNSLDSTGSPLRPHQSNSKQQQQPSATTTATLLSPIRRLFGGGGGPSNPPPRAATTLADPTFGRSSLNYNNNNSNSSGSGPMGPSGTSTAMHSLSLKGRMPLPPTSTTTYTRLSSSNIHGNGGGNTCFAKCCSDCCSDCSCSSFADCRESTRAAALACCQAVSTPLFCGLCSPCVRLLAPPRVSLSTLIPPLPPVTRERLASLQERSAVPFSPDNEEHLRELYSFAVAAFGPAFPMAELLKSPRWTHIGFQGLNPATDFRGAGVFGLQNLHYLVGLEPRIVRRMALKEHVSVEHYLPFAIAGLNLTFALLQTLSLSVSSAPEDRVTVSRTEAAIFLAFCTLLQSEQFAFEEIYRAAMLYLEELWGDTHAKYIQFPSIMKSVRERVELTLLRRPTTVAEFARMLNNDDDDDDVNGGIV